MALMASALSSVEPEAGLHGRGAIAEQPHRFGLARRRGVAGVRERQGRHREHALASNAERLSAGDEHLDVEGSARGARRRRRPPT